MTPFLTSPHLVDVMLLMVAAECFGLYLFRRRFGLDAAVWLNIAAGVSLMVALRAALAGAGAVWIGFGVTAALVAHASYLGVHIRRAGSTLKNTP